MRRAVVPPEDEALDFSIIAMGRFGGAELGFGSDADVMYVYDPNGIDPQRAHELALKLVTEVRRHSEDHRVPLDLDADLRPEGRNGPIACSIDAYAEYYRRWSLSWEAQALLRARGIAGSVKLIDRFTRLADEIRYPAEVDLQGMREIKRIKRAWRTSAFRRLPIRRGISKLGPGSLSDVEWLVQLLQLEHAHAVPALRTTSTMAAPFAAEEAGLDPGCRGAAPARGVAPGEPAALREHAPLRAHERCAAHRSAAAGRDRTDPGVPATVGDTRRGGLPRRHPARAAGVREAVLRLTASASTCADPLGLRARLASWALGGASSVVRATSRWRLSRHANLGRFSCGEPTGPAPDTNLVTRSNLLAYDITTREPRHHVRAGAQRSAALRRRLPRTAAASTPLIYSYLSGSATNGPIVLSMNDFTVTPLP